MHQLGVTFAVAATGPVIVRLVILGTRRSLSSKPIFWDRLPRVSKMRASSRRFTAEETYLWLENQMAKRNFTSLEELSKASGIDRGTLSRYFRQERRPSVDVIAPLCEALNVAPETLLIALGAVDRKK